MTDDLFQEQLIEMARHSPLKGKLESADLVLSETNASCGDTLTLYIQLSEPDNLLSSIKAMKWDGEGCIISQAAMSAVAEYMQGKKILDAKNLSIETLQKILGIDQIAMGRIKCLLLGASALQKAI